MSINHMKMLNLLKYDFFSGLDKILINMKNFQKYEKTSKV
jgi:hypothetical protein